MRLRCPHCHNPMEVVGTHALSDISCPSCGSNFNLISGETTGTELGQNRMVDRFLLLDELGFGHFGSVWKARDPELDRIVAIKIPRHEGLTPNEIELFLREARAAAQLKHPNIVSVHEVGRAGDSVYIASDYIEGCNLREWLTAQRLTFREAVELCVTIATALHQAHEAGVIHRDLKPGNILMDLNSQPHLTDFGLAKRESGEITMTVEGQILGTPAYMSPEQAKGHGHHADRRSDVYSLGVVLFELLTGELPFRGETRMLIVQILKDEPPSPRKLNARIPRDLETICLKCLEKSPDRRYSTAKDFADDLQRWLDGHPIVARPITAIERAWRWCRRNSTVAALLATIVLLIVTTASVGLSIWRARVAERLQQAENRERDLAETAARERELKQKALDAQALAVENEQKARTEETKAKRSEDVARAVLEFFLEKVLAAARPQDQAGGLGINATIRAAIDVAEAEISAAFQDKPLVEAEIRDALGQTYTYLSETTLALPQFERSHQIHLDQLGEDHPQTLSSMNNLAEAYRQALKLDLALPLFEKTLEKRKSVLGLDHQDTLVSMANLAAAYQDANKPDLAIPLFEQTLEKRKEILGPDHNSTINSMNNLAFAYQSIKKIDLALPLLKLTVEKFESKLGQDHPSTLTAKNNLATTYKAAGQPQNALPLFKLVLEKRQEKLGLDHTDTISSMNNLATAYQSLGQNDQALPLLEQAVEQLRAKLGPDHLTTLGTMHNLALSHHKEGQLEKAETLWREAYAKARDSAGLDHLYTQTFLKSLLAFYANARQPEKSEPLLRELAGFRKQKSGADSPQYAGELASLGQNLLDQQKYAAAEMVLRECLAIQEQKQPDNWTTFNTKSMLGGSLLGQKSYSDAETLLLSGYNGMRALDEKIPVQAKVRLIEAVDRLIQLYDNWEKPDEAAQWRKHIAELKEKLNPPK